MTKLNNILQIQNIRFKQFLTIVFLISVFVGVKMAKSSEKPKIDMSLPVFTVQEIVKYDGSDDSLPIYLIYNDLVYDVSSGKEFYKKGETYNYLVGKDSTTELNLFGGDIIKEKYPIIGRIE